MDNKTAEWVTVAQAAEITDRPTNSISNWYLYEKTVRHMRVSARRVLVHLGDCIEQDKIRSRRRRKPAPAVVAAPAVSVEVVPFSLAGQQCQGWRIDGEELLDAGLLGRLLDYADGRLTTSIRGEWSGEFISGEHFRIIEGPALETLKSELATKTVASSLPKHTRGITVLTRAGVALVLIKTHKPIGVALRRALAGAHFMRELLDGNPEPMRQAVAGPSDTSAMLVAVLDSNRAMLKAVEGIGRMLSTMAQNNYRPEPNHQPMVTSADAECVYMASKIADILRKEFPGRGITTRYDVHRLAKECGMRGKDGRSVPGYSRVSSISNGYGYIVKYSAAAIDTMREILSQQAEMPF